MKTPTPDKQACESCLFWDGKATAYLGMCCHPQNYPSRVPFDASCPLYIEHNPIFSLRSPEDDPFLAHSQ